MATKQRTINPPHVGEHFLHRRVIESDSRRPMEYVVTKVARGTVYYRPLAGGRSECTEVSSFYRDVVL